MTVRETFGSDVTGRKFVYLGEGESNVGVMTADDFLTRCHEIGVKELSQIQKACLMRVLGKPELSYAIRLNELEILMSNFAP